MTKKDELTRTAKARTRQVRTMTAPPDETSTERIFTKRLYGAYWATMPEERREEAIDRIRRIATSGRRVGPGLVDFCEVTNMSHLLAPRTRRSNRQ